MSKVYGYVRVSSMEQNEDRQMIALGQAGVAAGSIFRARIFTGRIMRKCCRSCKPGICFIS